MDPLFELALVVKAAQRELDRRSNDAMRPLGLTGAQADALTVIRQTQPISLKDLGDLLIAEAGHPSRLVDRLVESGWVERREAKNDRRRVVLSLTPTGRRLETRAAKARQQLLDLGHTLIGDRDLEAPTELLRDLLQFSAFAELLRRRRELFERDERR
ncbi:MAG TPA: winged helix DNA-binding protein [Solirubrobacteraceae bacterium]|nr:winged helix DNA-binding protein [Solirubrobacteraceae bacterium]